MFIVFRLVHAFCWAFLEALDFELQPPFFRHELFGLLKLVVDPLLIPLLLAFAPLANFPYFSLRLEVCIDAVHHPGESGESAGNLLPHEITPGDFSKAPSASKAVGRSASNVSAGGFVCSRDGTAHCIEGDSRLAYHLSVALGVHEQHRVLDRLGRRAKCIRPGTCTSRAVSLSELVDGHHRLVDS
jgi:hypothetical protein